jgi:transcription antitermination factor NusG
MEEAGGPDRAECAWQVAHTRPRCEKQVAAYCASRSVEHYLPLRRETKIYQRRKVTVHKPLFPGYVFARLGRDQRVTLLRTGQVVRLLAVPDEERLVFELEQVRRALEADPGLVACQAVRQGARVRITTGPFQGLEGVVEAIRGGARVVLNVEFIGQGVPVEVGLDMLEKV